MRSLPLAALLLGVAACSNPPGIGNDAAEVAANTALVDAPINAASPANAVGGEDQPGDIPANVVETVDPEPYFGRWRGVEGMYLVVTPKQGADVSLEMQWDLDHKGTFPGTVTMEGIRFTRDGRTELLRRTDGDATGLKYLAGKEDCLTVRSGEGYCRG